MVVSRSDNSIVFVRNILYSQIILIHFLYHVMLYSLPMFLIYMMQDIALTFTQAGILWTTSIVITTIMSIPVGYITDHYRLSHFLLMIASDVIMLLSLVFMQYARSFYELFFGFMIIGLGAAGYHPPAMAEITGMFEHSKGKALSLNINVGMIGTAISPLLVTGAVILQGTWQSAMMFFFFVGSIVLGFSSVILLFLARSINEFSRIGTTEKEQILQEHRMESIRKSKGFGHGIQSIKFLFSMVILVPLLLVSIRSSLFKTASFFTSFLYFNYLHLSKENTSIATAIIIGFGSFFTVIGGVISDRYKPRTAILWSSIGTFIATMGLVLIVQLENLVMFSILYFLLIASYYLASPATSALLADRVPIEKRGKLFGALFSLGQVLAMGTPVVFGYLKDEYSLFTAFVFMLSLGVLTILLASYIFIDDKKHFQQYAKDAGYSSLVSK